MSEQLGFTFYPKDWWTSDTFFDLDFTERYIFLECMFLMYQNDGVMKTQKTQLERRHNIHITDEQWKNVTDKFLIVDGNYTLLSVNKRLRKAIANRENGTKGGRPPKPKKPNLETQKNPPSESESESEVEKEKEVEKERIKTEKQCEVLSFFGFANSHFFTQHRIVNDFFYAKHKSGELDHFINQFEAYRKYSESIDPKYKFGMVKFLGDQSERFENGKWQSENWALKISETPVRKLKLQH